MSLHLSKGLAPKWAGFLLAAVALTGGLSYLFVAQFFGQKVAGLTNPQAQANIWVSPPPASPSAPPSAPQPENRVSGSPLQSGSSQARRSTTACGAFGITNDRFSLNRLC